MFDGIARDGGALAIGESATASIDRSWIFGNEATDRGGGLFLRGTTVISRSTISGNRAVGGGGAFVGPSASLTLGNSTVSGNVAVRGGGVRAHRRHRVLLRVGRREPRRAWAARRSISTTSESSTANSVFARNEASDRGPLCVRPLFSDGTQRRRRSRVRSHGLGRHRRCGPAGRHPSTERRAHTDPCPEDRQSCRGPRQRMPPDRSARRSSIRWCGPIRLRERRLRARVLSRPPGHDRRDSR